MPPGSARIAHSAGSLSSMHRGTSTKATSHVRQMDWTSSVASTLCFVHCAFLPIATSALPLLQEVIPKGVLSALLDSGFMWVSMGLALPFGIRSVHTLHKLHENWFATCAGSVGLALVAATHLPCMLALDPVIPHEWHFFSGAVGAMGLTGSQIYGWWHMRQARVASCCAAGAGVDDTASQRARKAHSD